MELLPGFYFDEFKTDAVSASMLRTERARLREQRINEEQKQNEQFQQRKKDLKTWVGKIRI